MQEQQQTQPRTTIEQHEQHAAHPTFAQRAVETVAIVLIANFAWQIVSSLLNDD